MVKMLQIKVKYYKLLQNLPLASTYPSTTEETSRNIETTELCRVQECVIYFMKPLVLHWIQFIRLLKNYELPVDQFNNKLQQQQRHKDAQHFGGEAMRTSTPHFTNGNHKDDQVIFFSFFFLNYLNCFYNYARTMSMKIMYNECNKYGIKLVSKYIVTSKTTKF